MSQIWGLVKWVFLGLIGAALAAALRGRWGRVPEGEIVDPGAAKDAQKAREEIIRDREAQRRRPRSARLRDALERAANRLPG